MRSIGGRDLLQARQRKCPVLVAKLDRLSRDVATDRRQVVAAPLYAAVFMRPAPSARLTFSDLRPRPIFRASAEWAAA
jgi:hypothetical protein